MSAMIEKEKIATWFASGERAGKDTILSQYDSFKSDPLLIQTIDAISMGVLIMNQQRQVVFANKAFLDISDTNDIRLVLGLRAGEALGCIYSDIMEGGCGTSENCRECGAVKAILAGLDGDQVVQECRISRSKNNKALDLRVMAHPLRHQDVSYTVFSITDIAYEKRKEVLERIFLHDVKNTAGGLQGVARMLMNTTEEDLPAFKQMINELSDKLLEEIDSFDQLVKAEDGRLAIQPSAFSTIDLLSRIRNMYTNHQVATGKEIRIEQNAEDIMIISDETILSRILGNMTKNALEEIDPGQVVTLACRKEGNRVNISVHNPGVIPDEVKLQIFQRSFSTKGTGRGLGTYSIKLLSEQYLKGKVGVKSSESDGTIFFGTYPLEIG